MRHVIIFDVKGDWVQMMAKPEEATVESKEFHERCHVRLMTFGTDAGWPATLNTFPLDVPNEGPGRDAATALAGSVRTSEHLAQNVSPAASSSSAIGR